VQPWGGEELVEALLAWLKLGYIVDSSDVETNEEDESESLFQLGERNRAWLDSQCERHNEELRKKLFWYREHNPDHAALRSEAVREITQVIDSFQKAALSRMVEHGVFWKYPGKGATLVEAQSQQAMVRCKETLDGTREYMDNWISQRKEQTPTTDLAQKAAADELQSRDVLSVGMVRFVLAASDSSCHSDTANHRIGISGGGTLEECAEAVSKNCKCGRGFEYDSANDGFCGCGAAGTPNSNCTESGEDFCFGTKRYLMLNPACMFKDSTAGANATTGQQRELTATGTSAPGEKRKSRQVCFDVYD